MPHGLLKDFKSNLPKFVALLLGKLQAFIISYAMAEINKIIQKLLNSCPPPEELARLTALVDTLKNLIGKYDKQVQKVEKIPATLEPAIAAGTVIVEILSHMPIPSSVPPGVGVPLGMIQTQANLLVFTRKMVETLGDDVTSINGMVESTKGIFDPVKIRIQAIEALLARCAENPELTDEERKSILDGAGNTSSSDIDSRAGEDYLASNGNTYNLSVIQENQQGYDVPRRRAIAKDFRGIVVLKGPLSFAGSTQVLIDELKFRLEQLNSNQLVVSNDLPTIPEVDFDFDTSSITNMLGTISEGIEDTIKDLEKSQKEAEANAPLMVPKRYSREVKRKKKRGTYVALKLEKKDKETWEKIKPFLGTKSIKDVFRGKMRIINHKNIIRA